MEVVKYMILTHEQPVLSFSMPRRAPQRNIIIKITRKVNIKFLCKEFLCTEEIVDLTLLVDEKVSLIGSTGYIE